MKPFGTITALLGFHFRLCESTITSTDFVEDLEVLIFSKLHFPHHTNYIFSHAVSLLGLLRTVNFSYFLSAEPPTLYCTLDPIQNMPLISGISLLLLMPVSLNVSRGSSYVFVFVFFPSLGIKLR